MQTAALAFNPLLNSTRLHEFLKAKKGKQDLKEKAAIGKLFHVNIYVSYASHGFFTTNQKLINTKRIEKYFYVVNPFAFLFGQNLFFAERAAKLEKVTCKMVLFIDVATFTCELYRFYAVINGVSDR